MKGAKEPCNCDRIPWEGARIDLEGGIILLENVKARARIAKSLDEVGSISSVNECLLSIGC